MESLKSHTAWTATRHPSRRCNHLWLCYALGGRRLRFERLAEYCWTSIVFDISNSMKPYASVFHACTSRLRPVLGLFEPNKLDEVSNRTLPTSHSGGIIIIIIIILIRITIIITINIQITMIIAITIMIVIIIHNSNNNMTINNN